MEELHSKVASKTPKACMALKLGRLGMSSGGTWKAKPPTGLLLEPPPGAAGRAGVVGQQDTSLEVQCAIGPVQPVCKGMGCPVTPGEGGTGAWPGGDSPVPSAPSPAATTAMRQITGLAGAGETSALHRRATCRRIKALRSSQNRAPGGAATESISVRNYHSTPASPDHPDLMYLCTPLDLASSQE